MAAKSDGTSRSNSTDMNASEGTHSFFDKALRLCLVLEFDAARELCEKEDKTSQPSSLWDVFTRTLSYFILVEKSYYSLSFLEKSWTFKKKESHRGPMSYEVATQRLKRLGDLAKTDIDSLFDTPWIKIIPNVSDQLPNFIKMRNRMIGFYTQLSSQGRPYVDSEQAHKELCAIEDEFKESITSPFLEPLKELMTRELSTMINLLTVQEHLSNWDFMSSVVHLQSVHLCMHKWLGITPLTASSDKKSLFSKHSKQQLDSKLLYQWMSKLYTNLIAKFSIYFHCILVDNATSCDMKNLSEKLDPDFYLKFKHVLVQLNMECIFLLFDTNGLQDFKGPGYHLPDTPPIELTGLSSYPIMVQYPKDFPLQSHLPSIISVMFSQFFETSNSYLATSIYQVDEKLQCAYYIIPTDPRVFLVGITSTSSSKRHSKVQSVLQDLAGQLRLTHVLSLLKPV